MMNLIKIRDETLLLQFYEKTVYGNVLIYPNTEIEKEIFALTGKKTITEKQLEALKSLGMDILVARLPRG